jgi:hypothetical protein
VYSRHTVHSRGHLWSNIRGVHNGKYCDKLLTLSTYNNWVHTARWECVLHYPGWHQSANVFWQLSLWDRKCNTCDTHECRSRIDYIDISQWAMTAAVEWEPWRSSHTSQGSLKYCMTISCIHITTYGALISFQMIVLYRCNFANSCNTSTLQMSSFCITYSGQTMCVLCVRVCSSPQQASLGIR